MHITQIELENIKSHVHSVYEFQRGTTAITGSNGAGKTTIIEAVAWTLFDLLDYKKDDFARRGSKTKGIARVTFESSLDERRYTVYRDTATGYYVYDPEIKARVADKKDEVQHFLRQHLGVEPGTDLEALFRRAIGVPQGTFTAIFIESATERKKAFDKLLKVEEYRLGAEKLLETSRHIEGQISQVRERIARAEGELSRFEILETELAEVSKLIAEIEAQRAETASAIESEAKVVAGLDAVEAELVKLKRSLEKLNFEIDAGRRELLRTTAELEKAQFAALRLAELRPEHELHLASLDELAKLEKLRGERDAAVAQSGALEAKRLVAVSDQRSAAEKLEISERAVKELVALTAKIEEQNALEAKREILRNSIAKAKTAASQIAGLQREIDERRVLFRENKSLIETAEKNLELASGLPKLRLRDTEITTELANLKAGLERDRKFQEEIKNGLCPILSQRCLNLKEGQTLESFVSSQFSEYQEQISKLQNEKSSIAAELSTLQLAERSAAGLESYKQRENDITEEGKRFKSQIEILQKETEELPKLEAEFSRIEGELTSLQSPRERAAAMQKDAEAESANRQRLDAVNRDIAAIEAEIRTAAEELKQFEQLEADLSRFRADRDRSLNAHREFLANESLAASVESIEAQVSKLKESLEKLDSETQSGKEKLNETESSYDATGHNAARIELQNLRSRETELRTRFELASASSKSLTSEMEKLRIVRESMRAEFAEKDRLEKVLEVTKFIRDTLKEAAPRVARNYVYHVSIEANQMYREITGNAERTLKWNEDYGIQLEEDGYDRPFLNLSGGEQMAAALSVRLALLKQLSDVRIAFFDEPTTNMDAERRENLATQIGNIKHFDQLFVISHDDTFEDKVDNVINVESGGTGRS